MHVFAKISTFINIDISRYFLSTYRYAKCRINDSSNQQPDELFQVLWSFDSVSHPLTAEPCYCSSLFTCIFPSHYRNQNVVKDSLFLGFATFPFPAIRHAHVPINASLFYVRTMCAKMIEIRDAETRVTVPGYLYWWPKETCTS